MNIRSDEFRIARRDLLKGTAALVVTVNVPPFFAAGAAAAAAPVRTLDPTELDTWLAISGDGSVTGFWGKMDMGQGVDTAIAQIIAEEMDVNVDRVTVIFGDSGTCADQGGASGSTGVRRSGVAFRAAAAEARLVLLEKASTELGVPLEQLTVTDGVVSVIGGDTKSISYAALVGEQMFNASIEWNGRYGNNLSLAGRATPKDPADYSVVGTSVPRKDIAGKILATANFLHDLKLPGMLHGRMLRPKVAGARVHSVDKESVSDIPDLQVVVENDFVGVVAPNEWNAVRAAKQLQVEWDETDAGFPTTSDDLFSWIRSAEPGHSDVEHDEGDVDAGLKTAARTITAEFEWPFQSHARMAPAASVADVRDGEATVWTDSQKPWDSGIGAARLLEEPVEERRARRAPYKVRSIWMPGPGSYGRSDAGDGAMDAVVLSDAAGKPVRLQWMRHEGHAWDPKGPASVITCRAGIDDAGNVVAYHYHIKGFSRADQNSRENAPGEVLAGHLLGHESTPEWRMSRPADSYRFPNKRYSWDALPPLRRQASPLRTAHFRDPYGPEVHFAAESFIDEMALASETDPLEFRLNHVTDERDAAVLRAAAELADWEPRTRPRRKRDRNGNYIGTGIAYAQRSGSVNAIVAEVQVNPNTGRLWVRRMWVGADHGLIVNPFTLDRTIEGNLMQAASRTLFEEVKFDHNMVTTDDWLSYPILESVDAPLEIKISHINRPELGPMGAGEPTTRVTPPAIANAFFDATGVRLRRVPFTPERVKAVLRQS
jgi:CO/xanthine dehydrogenase Mo-binding subunit